MTKPTYYQNSDELRKNQYRDSSNLDARANLHRLYSTAEFDWHPWVFDKLALEPGMRALECGCGPGWLWRENVDRIPEGCHITLTDLSAGMVAEAEAALAESGHHFDFQEANIQSLDFEDDTFDVVVANHILYHVPDLGQGLSEVRRVLKPNGRLVAATNGNDHMKELPELVLDSMDPSTVPPRLRKKGLQLPFRLENGRDLLSPLFTSIERFLYHDSLYITEVEPLLAYVFSMIGLEDGMPETAEQDLREAWNSKLAAEGAIKISKHSGIFVASQ